MSKMPLSSQAPARDIKATVSQKSRPTSIIRPTQLNGARTVSPATIEIAEASVLQTPVAERCRRSSLIPRSASNKHHGVMHSRGGEMSSRPGRNLSGARETGGLQRSQSTTKVGNFRQNPASVRKRHTSVNQVYLMKSTHPGTAIKASSAASISAPKFVTPSSGFHGAQVTPPDEGFADQSDTDETRSLNAERQPGFKPSTKKIHRKQTFLFQRPLNLPASGPRERDPTSQGRVRSAEAVAQNSKPESDKPTFSALQHFTPKRLAPDVTPSCSGRAQMEQQAAADRLSREHTELKLELLQLHMLHRNSSTVQQQWQSSAEDRYKARFLSLAMAHKSLTSREGEFQEQVNATAFIKWAAGPNGLTVERRVHVLSRILSEVCDLSEPNGKYSQLLESFEHWYNRASKVLQLQSQPSATLGSVSNMEGIGDGWKAEAAVLNSKLHAFHEQLRLLGEVQPESDLARCTGALASMLDRMLEELDLVQRIEREMVLQGVSWIKKSIDLLTADVTRGMSGRSAPTYVTLSAT